MKTHALIPRFLRSFRKQLPLTATLIVVAAGPLQAADDILIDAFDTADGASQWSRWWGSAAQTYEWDATVDADNNASSGSLKVTIGFDIATHGGENQFASIRGINSTDGSQYTNLVFDLRWAPSSPQRSGGDFGYLEVGFRNADFSQNWLPGFAVSTNEGWQRISLPINPNAPKITDLTGVTFKMWSGDSASGFTGTATFWVDNVRLIARTDTEVPPTTLQIEKARPGLRIFTSAGGQYQRQSIRTVNPAYTWVGAQEPVTYSVTIDDYPSGNYSGFQTHLFLIPGTDIPTWETSADWNRPNVIFFHVENNADGSAYAAFRYKTNQPSGNSMLFGNGMLAGLGAASARGTWSLTFAPDGNIALTAPGGAVTNFAMPTDAVALFSGSTYAYFGAQPNQVANVGQSTIFSRIQISGVGSPIDSTFSAGLDSTTWQAIADDATGLVTVPPDALYWLNWTLPDRGFGLEAAEDLNEITPEFWTGFAPTIIGQIGNQRRSLVYETQLPFSFTGNYFFRMHKPQ